MVKQHVITARPQAWGEDAWQMKQVTCLQQQNPNPPVLYVLLPHSRIDYNVIQIYLNELTQIWPEYSSHDPHESTQGISKSKG